ncbi:hypothetical protein [Burkholderia thailandensis]|uniref:hypothetical protein n=1 Tax=Burkholderia thailandensis TaxID=57975 RepID=UPI001EE23A03|nr:hypothetical protein [Burkholderia thailandensis]
MQRIKGVRWEVRIFKQRLSQIGDLMSFGIIQLDYEEVLAKHYRRWIQPGDTVIDVGAHLGLHLSRFIELAGPTGQVIGFEPLPFAFDILSTQHACPTLTLNNVALAHGSGMPNSRLHKAVPEKAGCASGCTFRRRRSRLR